MRSPNIQVLREHLTQIFMAGVASVHAAAAVKRTIARRGTILRIGTTPLNLDRFRRVVVVGAGKATAAMAQGLEEVLGGYITGGVINVKRGHGLPLTRIVVNEAGHPLPDGDGLKGTEEILKTVSPLGRNDLVICLLSGGGSALMVAPAPGISLEEKQRATDLLLRSGATVKEINRVRKHLSRVKGGLLARAAAPAKVVTLLLSDVVGDSPETIASGPTFPDDSTYEDCLKVLELYRLKGKMPVAVVRYLEAGARGLIPETPSSEDRAFRGNPWAIVGSNWVAAEACLRKARRLGYRATVISSSVEGEASAVGKVCSSILREIATRSRPLAPPACVIMGGETTVTVRGRGLGGRNQELALSAAITMEGLDGASLLSAGTDGTDGPTDVAGAFADGKTVDRARAKGLDPVQFLKENDSYRFFKGLGEQLVTGPTHTNVMDLIIMIAA